MYHLPLNRMFTKLNIHQIILIGFHDNYVNNSSTMATRGCQMRTFFLTKHYTLYHIVNKDSYFDAYQMSKPFDIFHIARVILDIRLCKTNTHYPLKQNQLPVIE